MALILCPGCSAKVSDKALSCPKCGCELHAAVTSPPPTSVQQPLNKVTAPSSAAPAASQSTTRPAQKAARIAPTVTPAQARTQAPKPTPASADTTPPTPTSPSTPQLARKPNSGHPKTVIYVIAILLVAAALTTLVNWNGSTSSYPQEQDDSSSTSSNEQSSSENSVAGVRYYTFADNTWLRSTMVKGVEYNKVSLLKANTPLTGVSDHGEWLHVRMLDGTTGYVATDFLMTDSDFDLMTEASTTSQRAKLPMAKYRRAIALQAQKIPGSKYSGQFSEQKIDKYDETAILMRFVNADGQKVDVLFVFSGEEELPCVHHVQEATPSPHITRDSDGYRII